MQYAPSSRQYSDLDCTLSDEVWSRVQKVFGPQNSLDSNCRRDRFGSRLSHFTPCHTPDLSGINVCTAVAGWGKPHVFLPFVLIGPLLRFLIDQRFQLPFTIIVLDIRPRRYWRELLQATSFFDFSWGERVTIWCCFFLLLSGMLPQTASMGPLGIPLRLLTFAPCLLKNILNYLLGILFCRSHVPGKQPCSAHLSFTLPTITPISVKLVVRRRETLLFRRSSRG